MMKVLSNRVILHKKGKCVMYNIDFERMIKDFVDIASLVVVVLCVSIFLYSTSGLR